MDFYLLKESLLGSPLFMGALKASLVIIAIIIFRNLYLYIRKKVGKTPPVKKKIKIKRSHIVILISIVLIIVCGVAKSRYNGRLYYKFYAAEQFGVSWKQVEIIKYSPKHKELAASDSGEDFQHTTIPAQALLQIDEKEVLLIKDEMDTSILYNDYYFVELYEGVKEYYKAHFGIDNLAVDMGEFTNSEYLRQHVITKVDDAVINQLVDFPQTTTIYIPMKGDIDKNDIEKLIDKANVLENKVSIIIVDDSYRVKVERKKQPYGFDRLCVDCDMFGIRSRIYYDYKDAEKHGYTTYQGYAYSKVETVGKSSNYGYRTITVNGGADVFVLDKNEAPVASIVSGKCDANSRGICAINSDDEMNIYIPASMACTIKITAANDNTISYNVVEYNGIKIGTVRLIDFNSTEMKKGESLTANIPAWDIGGTETVYSDCTYTLINNKDQNIAIALERFEKNAHEYYQIKAKVSEDAPYGMALGTTVKLYGSYAKLSAKPFKRAEFLGWYSSDNVLVSTDNVYRFKVTKDETLIAKFKKR